ncbi:MAG: HNH endonuclease [Elusimicrobia bacterium]|nr:HNH endonuclease [Elusimicrobiota bacterium]
MDDPCHLSDEQLLTRLDVLAKVEREHLHDFLACLGEADRRKLPEARGYSSTFEYCVRGLKLSEDESYRRIQAARAGVRRPELLSALADGELSLTAVSKLAPHIHRDDAPEIIARAQGKDTREIEALLAPLRPEPEKRVTVRTVSVVMRDERDQGPPVVSTRVDFSFRGSLALRQAIEHAKGLLAHKFPFGELDHVLLEVLQDYLERHDPQRVLDLGRTTAARSSSRIAASVRRAVWARDGGRCSYIGPEGVRCQSRRMLELDHIKPKALGGGSDVNNLRLLCRPHNDAERRRVLGEGKLSTDLAHAKSVDNSNLRNQP